MPLTDAAIRNAKPGPKPIKLSDGAGLQLHVSTAGGKVWNLAFRFAGRQQKFRIGAYPAFGLADARSARDAAKKLLEQGINPIEHGRSQEEQEQVSATVAATTFRVVADELIDKKRLERKAPATLSKIEWLLGIAKQDLGDDAITEIKAPKILNMLRKQEEAGKLESAKRLRSLTSEVFRYAIATARAEIDPAAMLVGALRAPIVRHRSAITDPTEFGGLLRAIDGFKGQATTRAALQLMALLFPRPGELRQAEWVEFDLAKSVWTIPAPRTKLRRELLVPLAPQAIAIIEGLKPISGKSPLLLPGVGMSGGEGRRVAPKPMSENTMLAGILRLGYERSEHSAHGFRASASTLLYESGRWSGEAIETQLQHQDANSVRRAYRRAQFWDERVAMMTWWATELDRLRLLKPLRP
ncbi:MAG: integrase arm-type DNA-binding domain-containing protein [Bosea sp.]|uniref:tyrosine-type recombinase/integrase n=1 Tax=Bosea sp. (in: a-proteobacteria) TaxID=1871050 RepID=UPI00238C32CF|nr:integrase arm-type DNA-binding domain-containing protein [Bosea sp. (in: a-proteobacteria)]MCP4740212.1 integrase arm-type DNA-binding domain-containing protein [Bosea sp. (in: a-proteobacteria)]